MYGVAKRGNPGDFFGECGRAFGLRSATGSLGLTSGDGSLESSPVRPGCYLSIYLSGTVLILLILLVLYSDTRVGRQPDIQATPCPRWLSGSTPDRPPRASHT